MKTRLSGVASTCAIVLAAPAVLLAATVEKKSGVRIEGTVQGMIVQKEHRENSVTYVIRKGSDVVAIDGRGVTFKKGADMETLTTADRFPSCSRS